MKPNLLELETDYEEERIPANPTVISDYQQGRTSTATLSATCSCSLSVCCLSNVQHYWCFHTYAVFSHEVMPRLYAILSFTCILSAIQTSQFPETVRLIETLPAHSADSVSVTHLVNWIYSSEDKTRTEIPPSRRSVKTSG